MKKILVLLPLITLLGMARLNAQVSVNVNIGGPPAWGPYGYNDARFYFIPDIDVYYDVWDGCYWYQDYNQWICRPTLPPRYAGFDLYGCYKVVLDYRGGYPYRYYNDHRISYARYRNWRGPSQYTYRDRGYVNGYSRGYSRGYQRAQVRGNQGNHRPQIEQGRPGGRQQAAPATINQGSRNQERGNAPMRGNSGGNRGGGGDHGNRGGGNHGNRGGGGGRGGR
ncbi:MAG: hypothetical protein V4616_05265 [Bacteroidota bacterium]